MPHGSVLVYSELCRGNVPRVPIFDGGSGLIRLPRKAGTVVHYRRPL
jgi:hypothetical protein